MNSVSFAFSDNKYCLFQENGSVDFELVKTDVEGNTDEILFEGSNTDLVDIVCQLAKDEGKTSPSMESVAIHWVINGHDTKGWVHTHGMDKHGLPELELRNMTGFLVDEAGALLRNVCDYFLTAPKPILLGETMALSDRSAFRFVQAIPIPGQENHYEVERWQIVEIGGTCSCCGVNAVVS